VRSRNYQNFDEIAETTLVEESATASRQDRYRLDGKFTLRCSNCGKLGHACNKYYARVNPIVSGGLGATNKLLASDALKRATWPEIVENQRAIWKSAIPTGCRETGQDGRRGHPTVASTQLAAPT